MVTVFMDIYRRMRHLSIKAKVILMFSLIMGFMFFNVGSGSTLVLFTGMFLISFFVLYRSVIRPLENMSSWAIKLARGEFEAGIPTVGWNTCWQIMDCTNQSCAVYGKVNVKCWLVPSASCCNIYDESSKKEHCKNCRVYKFYAGDEMQQLVDAFNYLAVSTQEYTNSLRSLNFELASKNSELMGQKEELENQKHQLLTLNEELEESLKALDDSQGIIYALAVAVEAKDKYTRGHSERVAEFSTMLGRAIGLSPRELELLEGAALLHDIGKIGVSGSILRKPGALTAIEFQQVKKHPAIGERICSSLKFAREMLPVIRHHHEHYNGLGYPDGLKGEKIPLMARIIAVADAFDAMTSDRPYRPGMTPEQALTIMENGAGTQWDAGLVETFVRLIRKELRKKKGLLINQDKQDIIGEN